MAGKEIRAGKAFVEIVLRDKLQAGLKRAAAQLRAFARLTSTIGAGLTAASGSILGPLTAAVSQFARVGDDVQKMADRTGMSAEAVSQLTHAAELSGTSVEILEAGIRKMQKTMGEAAMGSSQASEALAKLGLSASSLFRLSPDGQLAAIADRIAAIRSPALRTAAAMEIFGKSGTQLLPMFARGAAGIQAMRKQADALGMTISTDMARSAAVLTDSLGTMWSAVKALTVNIGGALAPIVTDAADRISAVVASVTKFVRENQQLVVTVAGVAAAVAGAGAAFLAIGGASFVAAIAVSGLASAAGFAASVLGGIATAVGAVLSPLGLVVTALGAGAVAWLHFSGVGGRAIAWLRSRFSQLVGFVRTVAGGISDALLAGDLQLAARILWSGIKVAFYRGVAELVSLWAPVQAAASQAWTAIRGTAGQTIAWLAGQWEVISRGATAMWSAVVVSATSALGQVRAAVASGLAAVVAIGTRAWSVIARPLETVRAMWGRIYSTVANVASSIASAFRDAISWIQDAFTGLWQWLSATASQVVTLVGQAFTSIGQGIVDAFGTVTAFLGSAFGAYVKSGAAVASGLSFAFGSFKSSATKSLSAIAKAMMHGEFALAGEVAWTSIKLAFVQGIAWVTSVWTEFAAGLATIFDGVVVAIRTAWNNLTVFIGQMLMVQVARFQTLLDQLAQFDPTGLAAKLRSALDVNIGGTITAMEEDRERFNRGLAEARERRDSERAAHMQARLAETEARLADLRRQREDALARARAAVETSEKEDDGSPLVDAMDELRKALAEAAAAPKLFDAGAASDKLGPVGAGLDDMMMSSGGKGFSSQGTFSAAAVWGLAAGGVNERAAKAAEATAQNTRQLVDHARRGRIVFG